MSENVKVRLQIRGQWECWQEVEIPRADFDRLDAMLDEGGRQFKTAAGEITSLIDFNDAHMEDAEDVEMFEIVEESQS